MSMDSRAFLTAFVILGVPLSAAAQTEPVIIEAESASISSAYSVGTTEGATYVTIVNDSPGFGPPATAEGALTYSVTFPAAGNYDLMRASESVPAAAMTTASMSATALATRLAPPSGR